MGLFRCPKCDSICRTDEEVCHICGYRLKPEQPKTEEPKVEEKPQEEKKQESYLNQKFTIGSGFSRKSVFNSVDFDKKEEPKIEKPVEEVKVNDDPFASFDAKQEVPKEDIFAAFEKQASDANAIFNEKPIEPEEPKPINAEPVIKPVEEPKVTAPKVEEVKTEVQNKEVKEALKVEKEAKSVEEPKVEEKPKPAASNPYINNEYKANPSTSTGSAAASVKANSFSTNFTQTSKKGEPTWVRTWREKIKNNKKTAVIWTVVLFCLFILFLILVSVDQKEIYHSYGSSYYPYYSDGYYTKEAKGGWIFACVISGIGFFVSLIVAIMASTGTLYVKEIDGYYALVYGHSNDFKLILENRVVDRYYSSNYDNHNVIKLSGKLPNKKIVVATVSYKNYNRVVKVELLENKQNGSK